MKLKTIGLCVLVGLLAFVVMASAAGMTDNQRRLLFLQAACNQAMETAMRAREELSALTDEREQWTVTTAVHSYDMPDSLSLNCCAPHIHDNIIIQEYQPDRRTEEEKLVDEQKALDQKKIALSKRRDTERREAEQRQEKQGRIIVLKAQWELGKACLSRR